MEYPIRTLRQEMDMVKSEFAMHIGISVGHLKELEHGEVSMTPADKIAFATLGIDVNQLEVEHNAFVTTMTPVWDRP